MVKYKDFYIRMINQNRQLFIDFTSAYERFMLDPDKNKEEFNRLGKEVNIIVRRTDNKLCSQTEQSNYNKFSVGLSDKFWEMVRENYPFIDKVSK